MANILEKPGFQKLIHVAYGLGAALVIIGALFKLQHWTGAGIMLTIGMVTEFIIFILSALETMPKKYHWENIYPELEFAGMQTKQSGRIAHASTSSHAGFDLNIDALQVAGIKDGIGNLNESLKGLNSLASISQSSQQLSATLLSANQAVANMAHTSGAFSETCAATTKIVSNYATETQRGIENTQKTMSVYGESVNALSRNVGAINSSFELQLNSLNKAIGGVTASFEAQVRENQQYQQTYGLLNQEIVSLVTDVKRSVQSSADMSAQMKSLTENVARLNSVYGNMLTAITNLR